MGVDARLDAVGADHRNYAVAALAVAYVVEDPFY